MIGICRAELRKLTARPAILVFAMLPVVATVVAFYVIPYLVYSDPSYHSMTGRTGSASKALELYPGMFLTRLLLPFSLGAGMLALLVGTLSGGSEYGWGTLTTIYTQGPGRLKIFAGQLAAAALVLTAVLALTALLAAIASLAIVKADGKTATWPATIDILKTLGAIWLVLMCYLTIGIALANLFRNPALAVGVGLAFYLVIESSVVTFFSGVSSKFANALNSIVPGKSASALLDSLSPGGAGATPAIRDQHAILVLIFWIVLCVAISAALLSRRDVV